MCTVSFIPVGNKVIITSNRDEKIVRPAALPPKKIMTTADGALYFPVDAKAGGTWFITNNKGDIGVLLNGAYQKHIPQPSYRLSRGSILPTLFSYDNPIHALREFNFIGIENCTLVLYVDGQLHECIWDGTTANITQLDVTERYIWSSVTLYDTTMINERRQWFGEFINQNLYPSQQEIIHFHTNTGKGNNHYGLKMNRDNLMLTVSITSAEVREYDTVLDYIDCLTNSHTLYSIEHQLATSSTHE